MKKLISVIVAAMLITVLTACSSISTFNGSRTGNDSQLIMTYTIFNTTDSQKLTLTAGDAVHVELVVDAGSISYVILKENGEYIARGTDITESADFNVIAEESGTYTVNVTGKKTKGGVKFIVQKPE